MRSATAAAVSFRFLLQLLTARTRSPKVIAERFVDFRDFFMFLVV